MQYIAERIGVLGRGSLLLAPLLLGGCFYSPSASIASLPPNATPTVLLSQQQYDQSNYAAPSTEESTRASSVEACKNFSKIQTKAVSQKPNSEDAWAAESRASIVDDAALKKKLVICDGCTFKPTPQQRRETVEQTGSPAGWDDNSR